MRGVAFIKGEAIISMWIPKGVALNSGWPLFGAQHLLEEIWYLCIAQQSSQQEFKFTSRNMLVNDSKCMVSAGTAFGSCIARVLLWCAFQTVEKISCNSAYLHTFHQTRCYADWTVFHCFILCLCTKSLWLENLDLHNKSFCLWNKI